MSSIMTLLRQRAAICTAAAGFAFVASLCARADDSSCIVDGSTVRNAASSATAALLSPEWFDSSSFFFVDAYLSGDFDSYRLGLSIIFR